jgi:hypothetical protein
MKFILYTCIGASERSIYMIGILAIVVDNDTLEFRGIGIVNLDRLPGQRDD